VLSLAAEANDKFGDIPNVRK